MKLDFIEIGTSDFRTLANSTGVGISIEPIKPYFDNLPDRKGLFKINAAVSNENRSALAYYCKPDFIRRFKLPEWLRGCNSIDVPHTSVENWCKLNGVRVRDLVEVVEVQCITLDKVFKAYNVEEVDFIKIDTEGHDYIIVKHLLELDEKPVINKIQFESNSLMSPLEYAEILDLAKVLGYEAKDVISKGNKDTILTK